LRKSTVFAGYISCQGIVHRGTTGAVDLGPGLLHGYDADTLVNESAAPQAA
jgi:hypothetical protein